jgi:hypothetical protein
MKKEYLMQTQKNILNIETPSLNPKNLTYKETNKVFGGCNSEKESCRNLCKCCNCNNRLDKKEPCDKCTCKTKEEK